MGEPVPMAIGETSEAASEAPATAASETAADVEADAAEATTGENEVGLEGIDVRLKEDESISKLASRSNSMSLSRSLGQLFLRGKVAPVDTNAEHTPAAAVDAGHSTPSTIVQITENPAIATAKANTPVDAPAPIKTVSSVRDRIAAFNAKDAASRASDREARIAEAVASAPSHLRSTVTRDNP